MTDTLLSDWVSALSIVRYGVDAQGVRKILESTSLRWASLKETGTNSGRFTFRTIEGEHRAIVLVNPRIERFYPVERIEILAGIALLCHQARLRITNEQSLRIHQGVGVYVGLLINPVVRWRYLAFRGDYRTLPIEQFETRPVCPVCHIHVSTGHTNPRLHDGCAEYVKTIYAPAMRRQEKVKSNG